MNYAMQTKMALNSEIHLPASAAPSAEIKGTTAWLDGNSYFSSN